MKIKPEQQALITEDEKLRELLRCTTEPCVPPGLDARVAESYFQSMSELQAKSKTADIDLRGRVTVSLVRVFASSVFLTASVIFLIGLGWIKLPPEVIHVLLASTITQAVVLYKAVITNLFTAGNAIEFYGPVLKPRSSRLGSKRF